MSATTRHLLAGLAAGSLVAIGGICAFHLTTTGIQDAGGVILEPPPPAARWATLSAVVLAAGALGACLSRARPRRSLVAAAGIAVCALAAVLVGRWSCALLPSGLWADELLDVGAARNITGTILSVEVESLSPSGPPDGARVTLAEGRRVLTVTGADAIALLGEALSTGQARPTLGVAPGSAASLRIDTLLASSAGDYRDLEPYLTLFRSGKASAGHLQATAQQLAGGQQRDESLRGPMLGLVAEALQALPGFLPTEEVEAALRARLAARIDEESLLGQAAFEAARLESLEGLEGLVRYLDDPSYRVRLLAAQYLLSLVSPDSQPEGSSSVIPAAAALGEWQRLSAAWRGWFAENRTQLVFVAGRWRRPGVLVDLIAWTGCADRDVDCLGHVVGFLEDTDPGARKAASEHLRRLVCPEQQPEAVEPEYPLDEDWQAYAEAWRSWLEEHREQLVRLRCADSQQEAWGVAE